MTTGSQIEPTSPPPPVSADTGAHVDRQMARGAAWMVLGRLLERGIGLVSIVILARLLVPADFGLIGMASVVIGVIELLGTFGFEVALIQNTNAGRAQYDTAWTLAVLLASGIALVQLAMAAPAAWFYGEPRLQAVIMCLALGTLITGFENIGIVAFRKDLHFRKDFNLSFVKKLVMFAVTIPAALILRSYWALVIGQIVGRLMGTILTYVVQEYRPRFSLAARRELFHFGKWLIVNNILNFTSNRCADFLVGKTAGARQLGLFSLSYEIATLPSSDLITPINRAIYPGYAIKASDPDTLRRSYLQIIGLIALVTVPAGLGIAAAANLLVPVVLGPAWVDAAPCVALLAVYGVLLAIKANNHYVYLAMGRPWIATLLGTVQIVLLLPLIGIGAAWAGAFGAAVGYVAAQAVFTPISLGILCRALQLRVGELMSVLYRPTLAAAAMYLGVRFLEGELNVNPADGAALILPLLAVVAVGAALYLTILYALWSLASKPDGSERRTLDVLHAKLWPRLAGPTASSAP